MVSFISILVVCLVAAIGLAIAAKWIFSGSVYSLIFTENGIVESATLIAYLLAAVLFIFGPYRNPSHKWIPGVLCMIFAMREYNLHETISHAGFLFFPVAFKENYPIAHALFEGAAISFTIALFVWMLLAYRHPHGWNLRKYKPDQLIMVIGWLLVPVVILLDGFKYKVPKATGYELPYWAVTFSARLEELLELMIPVAFLLGILHFLTYERDR